MSKISSIFYILLTWACALVLVSCSVKLKGDKISASKVDSSGGTGTVQNVVKDVTVSSIVSTYSGAVIDNTPNIVPTYGGYYEVNVAPIFAQKCTACHNASDSSGGLDLTQEQVIITNINKIATAIGNGIMPEPLPGESDANYLTTTEVQTIETWVNNGEN